MSRASTVAHFRSELVEPTETFIYNYLEELKRVPPICVTHIRRNIRRFPLDCPVLQTVGWNLPWRIFRRTLKFLTGRVMRPSFDTPRVAHYLTHHRASVLHAHFGPTGCDVLALKQKLRLPLVTSFYGHDLSVRSLVLAQQSAYQHLFAGGDMFLVEGEHMKHELSGIGCPSHKIRIQRIAIDTGRCGYHPRLPKARDQEIVLVFCGRFVEKKGLRYALLALHRVLRTLPRLVLNVIGDGEGRAEIERLIVEKGLSNNVRLLGVLPYDQVLAQLRLADILIAPSVTAANGDSEGGAPTTLLDAQATGLPILTTDHADIPNVTVPGASALLSPERDVDGLADNLLRLASNSEMWADTGMAGRRFVEENHDIRKECRRLESKYLELMDRRCPCSAVSGS